MNFKYALIFLAAFLLSACASLNDPFEIFKSHTPSIETSQVIDENRFIEEFSIKAKFAYSIDSKGGSGRLIWRYENNQDEIDIFSPFNNQIAKIIFSTKEKKIIDANGKILSGDDFDHYIQSLFGKNISPDLFRHLITNHIERIKDLHREDNQLNRTTHFYNDEWNIVINAFRTQDKLTIPSKISISQGTFSFNFIVEEIINIAGK
ncbi:MAG: lipoprotein insertase outer membrane protein LolB [Candidatus Methylopumilus sp.]